MDAEVLERPLPKPTTEDYVGARLFEAIVEAQLALEFLGRGLVRNAVGKVFQSWRALMAALLRLELDKLLQVVRSEDERKWLMDKAIPRVPTNRMKALSQLLEIIGYNDISLWTTMALELHDYQYNGPDPDMALSKYRNRQEAAMDIVKSTNGIIRYIEIIRSRIRWSNELENSLKALKDELNKFASSSGSQRP